MLPLIKESIASVSGRFTNGRFFSGDLTRTNPVRGEYLAGYQKALEDLHNRIMDFLDEDRKLTERKKQELFEKKAGYYNPFLEDENA